MKLINEQTMKQILSFYSEESKELVKHQINFVENLIQENKEKYSNDKGFQEAVDLFLTSVIEGKMTKERN